MVQIKDVIVVCTFSISHLIIIEIKTSKTAKESFHRFEVSPLAKIKQFPIAIYYPYRSQQTLLTEHTRANQTSPLSHFTSTSTAASPEHSLMVLPIPHLQARGKQKMIQQPLRLQITSQLQEKEVRKKQLAEEKTKQGRKGSEASQVGRLSGEQGESGRLRIKNKQKTQMQTKMMKRGLEDRQGGVWQQPVSFI